MTFRSRPLLDLARGAPCMAKLPGICNGDPETTVAAHQNFGKGMGLKTDDFRIAFMCSACHHEIDNGKSMKQDERRVWWGSAYWNTQSYLWERGLIQVSGKPAREPAFKRNPKVLDRTPPAWKGAA